MEKDFKLVELFETYKQLLTEKQRDIFYSYYCLDLSLSEVAEESNSSRQSVYDTVKIVKAKLCEYESVLRLNGIKTEILNLSDSVIDEDLAKKLKGIIGR